MLAKWLWRPAGVLFIVGWTWLTGPAPLLDTHK